MTTYQFQVDALNQSNRRIRNWYKNNILKVLLDAKEKQVRGTTRALVMAHEFLEILEEPAEKARPPTPLPLRPLDTVSVMRPVEPAVAQLLVSGPEKECTEAYLRARNKKAPEEKYYFRDTSNWAYGWRQKDAPQRRDVYRGKVALLRDTFYRKSDLRPDPRHYNEPAGGEVSICSMYSCNPY